MCICTNTFYLNIECINQTNTINVCAHFNYVSMFLRYAYPRLCDKKVIYLPL